MLKAEIDRGKVRNKWAKAAAYYDKQGIINEIIDEPIEMSLDVRLKKSILQGKRRKRVKAALLRSP